MTKGGEIIAEPLLSFRIDKQTYACFGQEQPRKRILQKLEDFKVKVILAGEELPDERTI
jgi:hypothetical protein